MRASFLLWTLSLIASLGLFLLVFRYATSGGLTVAALALLALFWFVGIELGGLPRLIQRAVLAKADEVDGSTGSPWFVVVSAERRHEVERLEKDSRDNPTIR